MSNADTIKAGYEAFARQDIPAVLEAFDPGIEWYSPDSLPLGGRFKGHREVVGFFMKLPEYYQELRVEPDEFVEDGDTVVVLGHHRGKAGGGDFEVPFAHVWRTKDGKAVSFFEHTDTARLDEAVGA